MMGQLTTWTRARIFLIAFRWYGSPKNNFEAWIGVFKPKSQNRKTCTLSKLLHRFQPNFAQW